MIVTGQVVAHPGQIVQRVIVFDWWNPHTQSVMCDVVDGTWSADLLSAGEYGLIYFGFRIGQSYYSRPNTTAADATFAGRASYTRPAHNKADATVPNDNCQPVCHGPYHFSE